MPVTLLCEFIERAGAERRASIQRQANIAGRSDHRPSRSAVLRSVGALDDATLWPGPSPHSPRLPHLEISLLATDLRSPQTAEALAFTHLSTETRRTTMRVSKFSIGGILFFGILALNAGNALVAQTNSSWAEQWYRAKYGRPSPTEQAQLDARSYSSAPRTVATSAIRIRANRWPEQFYQAKHGRPTPREDARLREANLGRAAVMTSDARVPVENRFESWYRGKFGRPSPMQESR
jgi:hypothetical protein